MIVSETINGIEVELLLFDPDYSAPIELEIKVPSDAEKGETGKEERFPEGLQPRFKMSFYPDYAKPEAASIESLQSQIGTKRVAIPIFFDRRSSISDTFFFKGSHFVSWDGAGLYSIDSDDYQYVAPLLFGRLKNNTFQASTSEIGRTRLSFIEDCPASHRVRVVNVSTDSSFALSPDWRRLTKVLNSPIKYSEKGQSRELFIENHTSVFNYELNGSFTLSDHAEIAYLLSFWYQRKGRLHPFTVPAWFQPSANTPETPDAYRARFKGEVLRLAFTKPDFAKTNLEFVQLPWELNNSGIEHVTDRLFEDATQWDGIGSNVSLIDLPAGITHMPEKVARIKPEESGANWSLYSNWIEAEENDVVVISALLARTPEIVSGKAPRVAIIARDSSQNTLLNNWGSSDDSISTQAKTIEQQWTLPADTADFRIRLVSPALGVTVDPAAYSYFGDVRCIQYKAGAEVLSEKPVQAPKSFYYSFNYDVPNKAQKNYIEWEESVTAFGVTYQAAKFRLKSLTMGTRLFAEEAKILMENSPDNPLIEFVKGGLERLVKIVIGEADPLRPDSATGLFNGTLKSLQGRGNELEATFTAFGGVFNKRIPPFTLQPKCNYILGDANCKKSLPSLLASGSSTSADLSESDRKIRVNSMSGVLTTVNDPNSTAGDRFAGGYLEVGDGDDYQIRFIKKTTVHAGTDRSFALNRPLDPVKLDASDGVVNVYPGCGGTVWECWNFWDNFDNFGGHPFMPEQLDTVQGTTPAGK